MLSYLKESAKNIFTEATVVTKCITDDPWGPTAPEMDTVVAAFPVEQEQLLPQLLAKLSCKGTQWRRCYKTLLLLEHMLRFLPFQFIDDLYQFRPIVADLSHNFDYIDARKGVPVDHGSSVRERAKKVLTLLTDKDHLAEERRKADDAKGKFGSVSSEGATAGIGSNNTDFTQQGPGGRDSRIGADFTQQKRKAANSTPPPKPGPSSESSQESTRITTSKLALPRPPQEVYQAKVVSQQQQAPARAPVHDPFSFMDAKAPVPAPVAATSNTSSAPVSSDGNFDDFFSSRHGTTAVTPVPPNATTGGHDDTSFFGQPPPVSGNVAAAVKKSDGLDFFS